MEKIYEKLYKINKLNPWSMLGELDIIQMHDKDGLLTMTSFVEEEIKALNVFIGIEACGNYVTSLKIDDKNSGYSALRYLDCYSVYFVDGEKINKSSFEKYGYNDQTGYPVVSRNMYGYFQRPLTNDEISKLNYVLDELICLLEEATERKTKVDYRLDCYLSRMYDSKKKKMVNVVGDLVDIKSGIEPLQRKFNEPLEKSDKTVELDVVILPKIDGKIILLALAVDSDSNILFENATSEYVSRPDLLADTLVEVLNKYGKIDLCLRDSVDSKYLAGIIKKARLNYEIKALTKLDELVDKTVEEMLNLK